MPDVTSAQDFMRQQLVTLSTETPVIDAIERLLRDNISGAPVVDDDGSYLGVFSEKCSMNAMTDRVNVAIEGGVHAPRARDFMTCELITLTPEVDVFEAIDHLLSKRISGAPVVAEDGAFQGIFSEKTAMRVLIASVHDQFPGANVGTFMNLDRNRIISEDDSLPDVARKFQETPYRRLPILQGERLAGQISRRDVLRAELRLAKEAVERGRRGDADDRLAEDAGPRTVGDYMDKAALTTGPNTDLLSVAQMFLNSPYRRLPILDNGRLSGQVSRRDLLEAAAQLLRPKPHQRHADPLYLSPLSDSAPPSLS